MGVIEEPRPGATQRKRLQRREHNAHKIDRGAIAGGERGLLAQRYSKERGGMVEDGLLPRAREL
jgi:hypothetical protein